MSSRKRQFERKIRDTWRITKYNKGDGRRGTIRKSGPKANGQRVVVETTEIQLKDSSGQFRTQRRTAQRHCGNEYATGKHVMDTDSRAQRVLSMKREGALTWICSTNAENGSDLLTKEHVSTGPSPRWDEDSTLNVSYLSDILSVLRICGVDVPDDEIPDLSESESEVEDVQEIQYVTNEDMRDIYNSHVVQLQASSHDNSSIVISRSEDHRSQRGTKLYGVRKCWSPLNELYPFTSHCIPLSKTSTQNYAFLQNAQLHLEERLERLERFSHQRTSAS